MILNIQHQSHYKKKISKGSQKEIAIQNFTTQAETSSKINSCKPRILRIQPNKRSKLLMFPFPCFMIGCFISKTLQIEFNPQNKIIKIEEYPGLLICFKRQWRIKFQDVIQSQLLVVFNLRINKSQAYRLVLKTKVGDFQLTGPKIREDAMKDKQTLDIILKQYNIIFQDQCY